MQKPLKRFTRLYKEKIDNDQAFSLGEVNRKYSTSQIDFIKDVPKNILVTSQIFWRNYHDKDLNKAAREVRFYFIVQILVLLVFFLYVAFFVIK